jgi:hypothetical protein
MTPPFKSYWKQNMKEFYIDGFLSHLILNWLTHVRLFPKDDYTLFIGHGQNNRLTKWRSYMLMYVVHYVKSIEVYFLFHQWCMVYLLDEIEIWNDWNCSIYEVEIIVTRKFKYLWLDHNRVYLSYKFSKHLRVKEIVSQTCISWNAIGVWSFDGCNQTLFDMVRSMMK